MIRFSLLLLLIVSGTFSQTLLSSFLDNQVLSREEGSPYIIDSMLVIKEGQHVTVQKGCLLYFAQGAGIRVEGALVVDGTPEDPVFFTSQADSLSPVSVVTSNPDTVRWYGISISENAQMVRLEHCCIERSEHGIESGNRHLLITDLLFVNNDRDLSIGSVRMNVSAGLPYSYPFSMLYDPNGAVRGDVPVDSNRYEMSTMVVLPGNSGKLVKPWHEFTGWAKEQGSRTLFLPSDTFPAGTENVVLYAQWRHVAVRKGIPVFIGCFGIASAAVSGWALRQWIDNKRVYAAETSPQRQESLKHGSRKLSAIAIGGGIVASVTIPFSVVLYLKNHPSVPHRVATPGVR